MDFAKLLILLVELTKIELVTSRLQLLAKYCVYGIYTTNGP